MMVIIQGLLVDAFPRISVPWQMDNKLVVICPYIWQNINRISFGLLVL